MESSVDTVSLRSILATSDDKREIERAATALAASSASSDLTLLRDHLVRADFLARLDSVRDPHSKTERFSRVVMTLGKNPADAATEVLASLLKSKDVTADVDRIDKILEATASLKPLPAARATIIAGVDRHIYMLSNIRLLMDNESPNALAEAGREIVAKPAGVADAAVVDMIHLTFVSRRLVVDVIRLGQALVANPNVVAPVRVGVVESFFDYQMKPWFGATRVPPQPPPWEEASDAALAELLKLADAATNADLPPPLLERVKAEARTIATIRAARGRS